MKTDTFEEKCERNKRVQARYDELMQAGKHGFYESMFRVVREEVERDRNASQRTEQQAGAAALQPSASAEPVQEVLSLLANLAAIVRVQNGNQHEDVNAILAHADRILAAPPKAAQEPRKLEAVRQVFELYRNSSMSEAECVERIGDALEAYKEGGGS
jgi:hypothetical protein